MIEAQAAMLWDVDDLRPMTVLDQVEGEQRRLIAPALALSAWKSGVPSSLAITASPSIRNYAALMRLAASTMAGKRSAQS